MSIYSHSYVIGLSWNSPPDGKCEIHYYLRLKCPTKLTPPAPLAIMSQDWTVDKAKQQLSTLFVAATQPHFYCEASVHKLITWSTSGVFFVSSSTSISSANVDWDMYNFNQSNFWNKFSKSFGTVPDMPAICRLPAHYCATQQCGLATPIQNQRNAIQCVPKFYRVNF